jgi:regulator of replication initiation timing
MTTTDYLRDIDLLASEAQCQALREENFNLKTENNALRFRLSQGQLAPHKGSIASNARWLLGCLVMTTIVLYVVQAVSY